jgi:hypothetical protein
MAAELYVWKAPVPSDADDARSLVLDWREAGAAGRFEPSDDVTWFSRELTGDAPPVWNPDRPATRPHPDRVAVVPLEVAGPEELRELLAEVYGLATKYDLVVYDPQRGTVNRPQAELAAYASATFWPRGAIRAFLAGAAGAILAAVSWVLGIPILSVVGILIGGFLVVMAVFTFVHEARSRMGRGRNQSG